VRANIQRSQNGLLRRRARDMGVPDHELSQAADTRDIQMLIDHHADEPERPVVLLHTLGVFREFGDTCREEDTSGAALKESSAEINEERHRLERGRHQLEEEWRGSVEPEEASLQEQMKFPQELKRITEGIQERWASCPRYMQDGRVLKALQAQGLAADRAIGTIERRLGALQAEGLQVKELLEELAQAIDEKWEGEQADKAAIKVSIDFTQAQTPMQERLGKRPARAEQVQSPVRPMAWWRRIWELIKRAEDAAKYWRGRKVAAASDDECLGDAQNAHEQALEAMEVREREWKQRIDELPAQIRKAHNNIQVMEEAAREVPRRIEAVQQRMTRAEQRLLARAEKPRAERKADGAEFCLHEEIRKLQNLEEKLQDRAKELKAELPGVQAECSRLQPELAWLKKGHIIVKECLKLQLSIKKGDKEQPGKLTMRSLHARVCAKRKGSLPATT